MDWDAFAPVSATLGGVLIGLATGLALLLNGKIAGISGVVGRILRPAPGDALWRVWFVVGLIVGAAATWAAVPSAEAVDYSRSGGLVTVGAAGLLVGFGARYGGGCTSGHGVCGLGRGSRSGLVGTATFMAVAIAVVTVRGWLQSGATP